MMACCLCFAIGAGSVIFAVVYFVFNKIFSPGKIPDLAGKHVMVTGGSSGIGLEVAAAVIRRGASVTLVARDRDRLEAAQKQLQTGAGSARVHIRPFDVTGDGVATMVTDAEAALGPVFMLVNCAGYSTPARFEDLTMDQVKRMMDVNFFGTFAVTQCVVRGMKQREVALGDSSERRGIVVLTSSQGGMVGVYGFTGYAATKAALIKFAEALHMEVLPHRLSVTVCVPPDTDTPGFEQENVSKPTETRLVSESAGLAKPEAVAEQLVRDALAGRFYSTTGVEGFMVTTLCAGMAPLTNFWDYCAQMFLSGFFRAISVFFLYNFNRIVLVEHEKRMNSAVDVANVDTANADIAAAADAATADVTDVTEAIDNTADSAADTTTTTTVVDADANLANVDVSGIASAAATDTNDDDEAIISI